MKVKNDTPCHNCEERHEKCHSNCERYKEFRTALDAVNAERIEQFKRKHEVTSYISDRKTKRHK